MIETSTTPATRLWTGLRALMVFAVWLFGGFIGGAILAITGIGGSGTATGTAIVVLSQTVAVIVAVVALSRTYGTGHLDTDVGLFLRAREWWGLAGGIGLQVAIAIVLNPVAEWLDAQDQQQAVADVAESTSDTGGLILLFFAFVVLAPIGEELLFRGVILRAMSRLFTPMGAAVVSGILFGLLHWDPTRPEVIIPVLGLIALGIVLGVIAVRRGSLGLPIMLHAGVNLLGYIGLVFADEIDSWLRELQSGIDAVLAFFL